MKDIIYRDLRKGEEAAACKLVFSAFDATVAPGYSAEGIREFRRYANGRALQERLRKGHFALVAERDGRLIGVVEVRENRHIAMLFVDPAMQGQGVGNGLLTRAIQLCRQRRPAVAELTVHSAPAAVAFYQKHGFRPEGPEREEHGIRYVPMVLRLEDHSR